MHRSFKHFALAALVSLAGCGDGFSPSRPISDLDSARRKWNESGYTNYAFTLRIVCFCVNTDPMRVTVAGDSVISVVRVSNGELMTTTGTPTINKLFDLIQDAITRKVDDLRATYDSQLGFPSDIYVDGSFRIADDETSYVVTDLVRR